jgi:hypothetical protein
MVHDIQITLDVHLDWVVLQMDMANTLDSILRKAIFEELCAIKCQLSLLFPFACSFYV